MAKPQSAASYIIQQKRAAMNAGQARPSSKALLQQYKSMNTAPVQQVTGMGPSNPTPGGRPLPLGPAQGGPISGPGAPLPATTPNAAILPDKVSPSYNAPAGGGMGGMKRGGAVKAKKMASGGMTSKSSASRRGDGIAQRGKTKGRML